VRCQIATEGFLLALSFRSKNSFFISNRNSVFGLFVAFGLIALLPSLQAQQNQSASDPPQTAWSSIQQLIKDLETAVQSKNLHGIHDPSMKHSSFFGLRKGWHGGTN
jgi:hypothetical protein